MEGYPPGFSVLVVDPDAKCLRLVSKMLDEYGHRVVTAEGGLDALHIIWKKEFEIDMILTEASLPDISIYELLEAIEKLFNLPTAVMSGFTDDMIEGLKRGGAKCLIEKPLVRRNIRDLWKVSYDWKGVRGLLPELTSSSLGDPRGIELSCEGSSSQVDLNAMQTGSKKKQYPRPSLCFLPSARQETVWTDDLHARFLRVVQIIGIHDSDPSTEEILRYMNVPWLTREHISSHFQKYRLISRLEKSRILKAITADYSTGPKYYQEIGGYSESAVSGGQHRQSLKVRTAIPPPGARMEPGSLRWRLWHYNYGTASASGSSATPCQQLGKQSSVQVKQDPDVEDQASQQLQFPHPPAEQQEEDDEGDESDSSADVPEQN